MVTKLNVLEFKSSEEKVYENGLTDKMISDREVALKESCKLIKEQWKKKGWTKLQKNCVWGAINILTDNS